MKKLAVMATIVAMLCTGIAPRASAGVSVQPGVIIICVIIVTAGTIAVSNELPPATNVNGNGNASFRSVATQQVPVASTQFTAVTLNFNGSDPAYGTFNFHFDPSRPAPLTTVTANQPGVDYPATGDVFANVIGTVSGLPGTYINNNVLHLRSTNLHSFNPQHNEVYTVVDAVTFSDPNNPVAATYTIAAGSPVTLN